MSFGGSTVQLVLLSALPLHMFVHRVSVGAAGIAYDSRSVVSEKADVVARRTIFGKLFPF